jgi:hypothetical protein
VLEATRRSNASMSPQQPQQQQQQQEDGSSSSSSSSNSNSDSDSSFGGVCAEVYLHVQTSNADALSFYRKKFGFETRGIIRNYYKRIEPPDCYVLALPLLLEGQGGAAVGGERMGALVA